MKPASLAQLFVMTAIVTTLLLPPAAGLAWLACALLGMPFASLVTFGDALRAPLGIVAWWVIFFAPAFGYATFIVKAD